MGLKLFILAFSIWCAGTYYIYLMDYTHLERDLEEIHILTVVHSCCYIILFFVIAVEGELEQLKLLVWRYTKVWMIFALCITLWCNFKAIRSERPYLKLKDVKTFTSVDMSISYKYTHYGKECRDWNISTDSSNHILVFLSLPAYIWLQLQRFNEIKKENRERKLKNNLHIIEAAQRKAKIRLRDIDAENEKAKKEIKEIINRIGG